MKAPGEILPGSSNTETRACHHGTGAHLGGPLRSEAHADQMSYIGVPGHVPWGFGRQVAPKWHGGAR